MGNLKRAKKESRKKLGFFGSFFPSKEQRNDLKLRNRMKICAFSIFIMWASSLKTAVYIASFAIDVPSILTSYDSCKSAFQVALDEKENFETCVDVQIEQCKISLDAAIELELNRVNLASYHNSRVVKSIVNASSDCTDDYTKLKSALETWTALEQVVPIDNSSCSAEEQDMLLTTVASIETFKTEAFGVSTKFEEKSRGTLNRMIDYTKKRTAYDQEYLYNHSNAVQTFLDEEIIILPFDISEIVENITEAVSTLTSCMSLNNASFCQIQHDLNSTFTSVKTTAEKFKQDSFEKYMEKMDTYQKYYDEMYAAMEGYESNLMTKIEKWKTLYSNAVDVMDAIAGKLKSASGKSVVWFTPMSMEDFMPPDLNYPALLRPTHLVDALKKAYNEQIQSTVESAYDYYMREINQGFDNINEIYHNWTLEVTAVYNIEALGDILIPDDYDPPRYHGSSENITDLDQEQKLFRDMSEAFVKESTLTINNVANATSTSDEMGNATVATSSMKNLTSFRTELAGFDLNFEDFMMPRINFDLWFLDIIAISDILLLTDFAIRTYFSIRMCFKYWSASAVKIPHVDIRTDKELASNPLQWNNGRLVVALVSNPLTGFLLASILISWAVTFTTSVYVPIFDEYRIGCIPKDANGTFISENIYSSAYNYAYNQGSASLVKGVESLEKNRTNTCSSLSISSARKQNDDVGQFVGHSQLIMNVQYQMGLFDKCIDSDVVDTFFETACCDQSGYDSCASVIVSNFACPLSDLGIPYSPPGQYLRRQSCDVDLQNEGMLFQHATFDCMELPSCNVSCSGPRRDKLRRTTKECSCIGEWLLHSYWLRGIMSILIFLILNVSRITFVDGLARMLWKHLHPGSFTVYATCDESGAIIIKDKKRSEEESNQNIQHTGVALTSSIVHQLALNSFKFRMGGLMMVLGSISLNLLWVVIVVKVKSDLSLKWL